MGTELMSSSTFSTQWSGSSFSASLRASLQNDIHPSRKRSLYSLTFGGIYSDPHKQCLFVDGLHCILYLPLLKNAQHHAAPPWLSQLRIAFRIGLNGHVSCSVTIILSLFASHVTPTSERKTHIPFRHTNNYIPAPLNFS